MRTLILVFNIIYYSNEPGLLEVLADLKTGAGKEKGDPGSPCYDRKFKNALKKTVMGFWQENIGTILMG